MRQGDFFKSLKCGKSKWSPTQFQYISIALKKQTVKNFRLLIQRYAQF